ncbi:MAG: hypothetical protein R2708_08845 [Vicinamibacterales bacterium]
MKKVQRLKYEMFVRVRDFGAEHTALFPEGTIGGQAFARVLAAAAKFEEQLKDHVLGRGEARRIKAATRDAVFDQLKTIAAAARRLTRAESGANPFQMPVRRNLAVVLSTARAFMQAAASRQAEFEKFGLPPTFIADFGALVDQLQQAADVRLSAKTARSKAQAGINVALADGLDAVRDLDVVVAIATRQTDPATFAAWTAARRIEGQNGGTAKAPKAPPAPEPAATPEPLLLTAGELKKAS